MPASPETTNSPLRVAIIGSGPSAFFAAEHLLERSDRPIEIDMFERLPTPFGLVRGGVAPDHQKIKSVTKAYDKTASHPGFRFLGNVEFGRDIHHADLIAYYHLIFYATGAQTDRKMGIPGEDLPSSHAATEFVGWYNAHPDYRELTFDLSQARAAVIGNGNVAMDVMRILACTPEELHGTDIADYALDALSRSNIKEIYIFGRRGPAQAAFTNPELIELAELAGADVIVAPQELELDPLSRAYIQSGEDRAAQRNIEILTDYSRQPPSGKPRRIIMRFLRSPVEIIGSERVEAIKVVANELYKREDGSLRPRPTGQTEVIPVGLVFRSIGYRGVPLPGVPFDQSSGTIPNDQGRILDANGQHVVGEYAVGWIKRGPTGIIGTNKPDSQQTVDLALTDAAQGIHIKPTEPAREAIDSLLHKRGVRVVSYADWHILDRLEQERGQAVGRPRIKFSRVDDMLRALEEYKQRTH
ncbi:MAG: FAD/NAD(P)-binding protein [Anaerolineae bacterium]|nr:FAD/NAD(P)-binding protein [Anaerolineae bacterium]